MKPFFRLTKQCLVPSMLAFGAFACQKKDNVEVVTDQQPPNQQTAPLFPEQPPQDQQPPELLPPGIDDPGSEGQQQVEDQGEDRAEGTTDEPKESFAPFQVRIKNLQAIEGQIQNGRVLIEFDTSNQESLHTEVRYMCSLTDVTDSRVTDANLSGICNQGSLGHNLRDLRAGRIYMFIVQVVAKDNQAEVLADYEAYFEVPRTHSNGYGGNNENNGYGNSQEQYQNESGGYGGGNENNGYGNNNENNGYGNHNENNGYGNNNENNGYGNNNENNGYGNNEQNQGQEVVQVPIMDDIVITLRNSYRVTVPRTMRIISHTTTQTMFAAEEMIEVRELNANNRWTFACQSNFAIGQPSARIGTLPDYENSQNSACIKYLTPETLRAMSANTLSRNQITLETTPAQVTKTGRYEALIIREFGSEEEFNESPDLYGDLCNTQIDGPEGGLAINAEIPGRYTPQDAQFRTCIGSYLIDADGEIVVNQLLSIDRRTEIVYVVNDFQFREQRAYERIVELLDRW